MQVLKTEESILKVLEDIHSNLESKVTPQSDDTHMSKDIEITDIYNHQETIKDDMRSQGDVVGGLGGAWWDSRDAG